jgi:hypothetical protein
LIVLNRKIVEITGACSQKALPHPFLKKKQHFFPFYIVFFFTFQDENSQKERYGVDMWLTFFFFGLCSQSILDFRFVPLLLKEET